MRSKLILIATLVALAAWASAGTISIYQTHEEEPNGTIGQADTLNNNSGILPCGFYEPFDDDVYEFTTTVDHSTITVEAVSSIADTVLIISNAAGAELAYDDLSGSGNNAKIANYDLGPAGTYYIWVSDYFYRSGAGYTYTLTGQIVEPEIVDTDPPTYPGSPGIDTAARTNPTTVQVTWHQASDDISFAANIKYNIYYDVVEADVFAGIPRKTVTGSLQTTVNVNSPYTIYYFGVRAEDEAGNEDTNTETRMVEPLTAVRAGAWALYE